jgi:ATP-dependent exoDNAse (exonuclease V) beta subunit
VAVTRAKNEVVFVTPLQGAQQRSFWKPLQKIFQIDLKKLATEWFPAVGVSEMKELTLGDETISVLFEAVDPHLANSQFARLASDQIATLLEGSLPTEPPRTDAATPFDRVAAARRIASARRRHDGIATHRFLELWDFDKRTSSATFERVRAEMALPLAAVEQLRRRVEQMSRSSVLERIRAGEIVGRELEFFALDDEMLREGRIDFLLREGDALTLFDFKTGERWKGREEKDGEQVREYCRRISQLYGEPCRALLWYVDERGEREVVEV